MASQLPASLLRAPDGVPRVHIDRQLNRKEPFVVTGGNPDSLKAVSVAEAWGPKGNFLYCENSSWEPPAPVCLLGEG